MVEGQDVPVDDLAEPELPGLVAPHDGAVALQTLIEKLTDRPQGGGARGTHALQDAGRPQRAEAALAGAHAQPQRPQHVVDAWRPEAVDELPDHFPGDQLAFAD